MYQLPVVLSAFANSPDQAYLGQLKAEHDYLLEVFSRRPDLRHTPLLYSGIEQLLQFIQEYSADLQILHFGGHADGKQLFLEDQAGQGAGLARLLGTCPQLKLVVLNGCKTQAQADVYLAMGIPAVIATTCSVADGQATKFAQFLYRALANHQSIEHAFRQAMGAMEFAGEATSDDGVVVYRGLERPKGDDKAPWKLYIQEERAGEIKT